MKSSNMKINTRELCYIIAEIGVNHNGDMNLAKELIVSAIECGANAVKFQTFKAERLVSRGTPKVDYQKRNSSSDETHFDMIKKLELSHDDHFMLKDFTEQRGIDFISTPYDVESAKFLNESLDLKIFKVASADLVDLPLHKYIASSRKPVLVSVGMASLAEIDDTIKIYEDNNVENVTLLHCVSNYPCHHKSLNLSVIPALNQAFNYPVGFSDHSIGFEASICSVSLGVKVIEKHFTLDKNIQGPDHLASSTPREFRELVDKIRLTESMLGNPRKVIQQEELQMYNVSRKSIVLANDLRKGHQICESDLCLKRPGTGLPSKWLNYFIGKKLLIDKEKDSLLALNEAS